MTNSPVTDDQLRQQAQSNVRKGAFVRAMQLYYELHERDPASIETLSQLVAINLHLELFEQAMVNLHKLIQLESERAEYYDKLAEVYAHAEMWDQAANVHRTLILLRPLFPDARFNHAFYLRRVGRFEDAIGNYERAIKLGIDQPEEAHLNIAVILADDLRREEDAESHLLQALKINKRYLPALYNLANLYEDRGNKTKTIETFRKILAINPSHVRALSRLVDLVEERSAQDQMIQQLAQASQAPDTTDSDRTDLFYSLGQVHDHRGEFDLAFHSYVLANDLNAREIPPYDAMQSEAMFSQIIDRVSSQWVESHKREDPASPIFISGMFRSGSTLVEQLLASHPDITPGGERDTFVREFGGATRRFPDHLDKITQDALNSIATRYHAQSAKLFPFARHLTDKRPDNFLYLGVVKALFPNAKFVYTQRNPVDNCLSIFFVRLAASMNYAVDLSSIQHYYDQQMRLLNHWQSILGDDLYIADYDALIANPNEQIKALLEHLGLSWHDDCLNFHELRNTVKTASVWQVRQPLYATSSGRWQNYRRHIFQLLNHYNSGVTR